MAPPSPTTPSRCGKRARSRSPSRSAAPPSPPASATPPTPPSSSSSDPDGPPAMLREMLDKKPQIIGSIEKLMASSRSMGCCQAPAPMGLAVPGPYGPPARDQWKPPLYPSGRIPAALKGKAVVGDSSGVVPPPPCALSAPVRVNPEDTPSRIPAELKGKAVAVESSKSHSACTGERLVQAMLAPPPPPRLSPLRLRRPGRFMIRPPMDPLSLQIGGSFVKHFTSPFKESIEIPVQFWLRIPNRESNSVIIFGDAPLGVEVQVEQRNGRCLFTEGWSDFVTAERVSRYDTAVFAWLGSNYIGMRLYGIQGAENPMSRRPPVGHPMLQDFANINAEAPQADPHVAVPNNLLDMVYELGTGVSMNGLLFQTLADVWHNQDAHFPMYVCKITSSQLGPRGHFFFSSSLGTSIMTRRPPSCLDPVLMVTIQSWFGTLALLMLLGLSHAGIYLLRGAVLSLEAFRWSVCSRHQKVTMSLGSSMPVVQTCSQIGAT